MKIYQSLCSNSSLNCLKYATKQMSVCAYILIVLIRLSFFQYVLISGSISTAFSSMILWNNTVLAPFFLNNSCIVFSISLPPSPSHLPGILIYSGISENSGWSGTCSIQMLSFCIPNWHAFSTNMVTRTATIKLIYITAVPHLLFEHTDRDSSIFMTFKTIILTDKGHDIPLCKVLHC